MKVYTKKRGNDNILCITFDDKLVHEFLLIRSYNRIVDCNKCARDRKYIMGNTICTKRFIESINEGYTCSNTELKYLGTYCSPESDIRVNLDEVEDSISNIICKDLCPYEPDGCQNPKICIKIKLINYLNTKS